MSKDFCMDCGMLLSPDTSLCSVCGFDNTYDRYSDMDWMVELNNDAVPENFFEFWTAKEA